MQQHGITKGDVLQKLASLSFVVASVLLIVFNALYPRTADPSDVNQVVKAAIDARGGWWELIHLALAVGIWGIMIGFAGVYRAISTGSAAVWARLGFYGVIVGATLWSVGLAVEGFGLGLVVRQPAPASGGLPSGATALAYVGAGLLTMEIIVLWLALIFLGVGMAMSKLFPGWMGWAQIILGVLTAATGVIQVFTGPTVLTMSALFPIFAGLTTIYSLILGIWLMRKAW